MTATNHRTAYVVPTKNGNGRVIVNGKNGRRPVRLVSCEMPFARASTLLRRYMRRASYARINVHKMF